MAKIGLDARLYGPKDTGIGRYVQNLVIQLTKIDHKNEYVIFGPRAVLDDIAHKDNFLFHELTSPVYGFDEQFGNLTAFNSHRLDILHVPHFNAPVLYRGKLVMTLHDLIKSLSVGPKTSTLPLPAYFLKHFVYQQVVRFNLAKADHILTPSQFWKDYLICNFKIKEDKITVTYEASTGILKDVSDDPDPQVILKKYSLNKPFLLYTGNLYPHKNVPFLINAVKEFNTNHQHKFELVLIGAKNHFLDSLPKTDFVKILGFVPDVDLSAIYKQSLALVQPSLYEGFGLTGLEAMSIGTPVLSSNSSCLPEIYQDAALYFDPRDQGSLISVLDQIISNKELVDSMIAKGLTLSKRYSWNKMAKQTLGVYKSLL